VKQGANLALLFGAMLAGGMVGSMAVPAVVAASTGAVAAALTVYRRGIARQATQCLNSGVGESVRYALPCAASNLVQFLNYRLSVYFVHALMGVGALGLYQTASF